MSYKVKLTWRDGDVTYPLFRFDDKAEGEAYLIRCKNYFGKQVTKGSVIQDRKKK